MLRESQAVTVNALVLAVIFTQLLTAARPVHAQTESVLYSFCSQSNCSDGEYSSASLVSDGVGNFYGTTLDGGAHGGGTVFELSPSGSGGWTETVLYNFCSAPRCADGAGPTNVILDSAG